MKSSLFFLALLLLTSLRARCGTVALNDEFATRQVLSGDLPLSWSGYAGNLLLEPADSLIVCGTYIDTGDCELEGSMWFEWTAPQTGIYDLRVNHPFGLTLLAAPPAGEPQLPAPGQKVSTVRVGDIPRERPVPSMYGFLTSATAGQRFWIMAWHEGDPILNDRASFTISRMIPAASTKEAAVLLPGTASVEIRQAVNSTGWWRWQAPSAGTWRIRPTAPETYATTYETVLRQDGSPAGDPSHSFTVSAGEELFIRSVSFSPGPGLTALTLEPFTPLQNFAPATALPLIPNASGAGFSFDVLHDPLVSGTPQMAWFSWIAPRDGVAGFRAEGFNMAIYRDEAGVPVSIGSARFYTPVSSGQRFFLSVSLLNGTSPDVRVEYLPFVRGSDSFAGASALGSALPVNVYDVLAGTTTEPGEPGLSSPGDRTAWWTFTPAADGILQIEGIRLNVYTGSTLGTLQSVASLNPGTPNPGPVINKFKTQAGTLYHLQVFDTPAAPEGLVHFSITPELGAGHDRFADAAVYSAQPSWAWATSASASFTFATAEPGEPPIVPGSPVSRTVWMRWTAESSGRVMALIDKLFDNSTENNPRLDLAVWKGQNLAGLERVPVTLEDWYGKPQQVFDAVAGTTYYFQFDAVPAVYSVQLSLTRRATAPEASDSFAGRLPMGDPPSRSDYTITRRATFEPGESTAGLPVPPTGFSSGSYWTEWTAPYTGVWRLYAYGSWLPYRWQALTVYRGPLADGQRIAVFDATHRDPVFLKVNAGETIAVGAIVFQLLQASTFTLTPAELEITPAVPGIALAQWYGLPSPANLNASYSSDGIPLLLKHALGLDPLRNSLPGGGDPNASRWPVPALTPDGDLSLTFRPAAPFRTGNGIDLSGEISPDLLSWIPAPETSGPDGERTAHVPAGQPERFLRLKASLR